MAMLGGDKGADDTKSPSMGPVGDDGDVDNASTDEGFSAAADEVFSALETKDVDAFSSALKTCIEMYK